MEAKIEKMGPISVVALRHVGAYHLIGPKFSQLIQWAGRHQVPMNMGVAMYYDSPDTVAAQDLRSDACMIVESDFELPDTEGLDIRLETIREGEYATITHMGPYEGIGDAWARFCGQALPALGRETDEAPSFEIYRNDCSKVKPEELQTDLYLKLK